MDEEPSWQRQLLIGLAVLLTIGVLIGGIVAVIAVKAADYAGLGNNGGSSSPQPLLPTTGDATKTTGSTGTPPTTSNPPPPPKTTKKPPRSFVLNASPRSAGSYAKVNLTGQYNGAEGSTLQVQRSVGTGPWSDFPTTTTVHGGTFATYIETGMTGVNHFRMLDKATGEMSNAVAVTIG